MTVYKAASALLLSAALATAGQTAGVERKSASPTAAIASSVKVPAGSTIYFISGTPASPIDPKDMTSPGAFGNTEAQTLNCLTKIKAQLAELGLGMGDIVKLNLFMVADPVTGKVDREGMTASFKKFFGAADQPNLPARTTVQVAGLGRPQQLIEIEAEAAKAP